MGGIDKNSELVGGRSVLEWSAAAMAAARSVRRVIIVTRTDRVGAVAALPGLADAVVVAGGAQRSESVRSGLAATDAEVVLVHDAARPLATAALADSVAHAARLHGAAVPVIPVVDSLKRAGNGVLGDSVDREGLVRSQTPQGVRRDLLAKAFAAAGDTSYSDEAALLEAAGITVATVPGESHNVKVTEPGDLDIVRAVAAAREGTAVADAQAHGDTRIGVGQDLHGFGPQMGLRLGGIDFADAPRLHGHSDGDVVLHATATAVLSAAGLGDLGRLFPAGDARTKGIDSAELLSEAISQAASAGWRVTNVQVSLVGARPRLGAARIDEMRARLAQLTAVDSAAVSLTASTGNLYGDEGGGRAISATCLVLAHRR